MTHPHDHGATPQTDGFGGAFGRKAAKRTTKTTNFVGACGLHTLATGAAPLLQNIVRRPFLPYPQ